MKTHTHKQTLCVSIYLFSTTLSLSKSLSLSQHVQRGIRSTLVRISIVWVWLSIFVFVDLTIYTSIQSIQSIQSYCTMYVHYLYNNNRPKKERKIRCCWEKRLTTNWQDAKRDVPTTSIPPLNNNYPSINNSQFGTLFLYNLYYLYITTLSIHL